MFHHWFHDPSRFSSPSPSRTSRSFTLLTRRIIFSAKHWQRGEPLLSARVSRRKIDGRTNRWALRWPDSIRSARTPAFVLHTLAGSCRCRCWSMVRGIMILLGRCRPCVILARRYLQFTSRGAGEEELVLRLFSYVEKKNPNRHNYCISHTVVWARTRQRHRVDRVISSRFSTSLMPPEAAEPSVFPMKAR